MSIRKPIHTTLDGTARDWLSNESQTTNTTEGHIIDEAINFYRKNRQIVDEYKRARIFLRDLIKAEIDSEYTEAKPFLRQLIKEELEARTKQE